MDSVLAETTEDRDTSAIADWILYDADCNFCTESAQRFGKIFQQHGFHFLPLQTPWVLDRLGLAPGAPLEEMRVLARDGEDYGGAEAVVFLARKIWWTWPLYALAQLPGIHRLIDRGYRWIAAHRDCNHVACQIPREREWPAWLGLLLLPSLAFLTRSQVPPWIFMWLMAGAIFCGCKWLTFRHSRHKMNARAVAYLFAWPGMDARNFLTRRIPNVGSPLFALAEIFVGALLLFVLTRRAPTPLLTGWIGMVGLIFILHFGLFHLLAIFWQAEPIMHAPWRAKSVNEFWGRRWNGAFNQLAFENVFRPLARSLGVIGATLVAFFVSGFIHETVISLPANAGYGLPTAYFLLQGGGVIAERSLPKIRGRVFTFLVVAAPAFWLFHPPFVRRVILPFMKAIGAL
jgi:alginate O-acetyltransferase complex protein AlgI